MSRDLRQYARQTSVRLLIGFLVLLFLVGDGMIWAFYGREAALLGLVCLTLGLFPLLLIGIALWGIELLARHLNQN